MSVLFVWILQYRSVLIEQDREAFPEANLMFLYFDPVSECSCFLSVNVTAWVSSILFSLFSRIMFRFLDFAAWRGVVGRLQLPVRPFF